MCILRYLHICPDSLVRYKNCLIRKIKLISEFMMSQIGQAIIAIHILPSIARSKDSQAMKFVGLIKYNVRNIFLENSGRKWGR